VRQQHHQGAACLREVRAWLQRLCHGRFCWWAQQYGPWLWQVTEGAATCDHHI
jgi:hypothetical protein